MSSSGGGRVFILGAGASAFAGFPLAKTFWAFMVDHAGFAGAMEFIDAHVSSIADAAERERIVEDLEALLTSYEDRDLPRGIAVRDGRVLRTDPKEKAAFLGMHRHLRASSKPFNFRSYFEARQIRRGSGAVFWSPSSKESFVRSLAIALLNHHACIRYCGEHFKASTDPPPSLEALGSPCPCCVRFSVRKGKALLAAIARKFKPGDTIVSFNYDALLESVLFAAKLWSIADGYGFPVTFHPQRVRQLGANLARKVRRPSPIVILKAHGSVNWMQSHADGAIGINYLGLLFDLPIYSTYLPDREKNVDPEIGLYMAEEGIMGDPDWPHTGQVQMSPTYRKNYDDEPYRNVWERIGLAIENASELTVAGYRLPDGDAAARTVLGAALRKNRACQTVAVVNPGDPAQTQWPAFLEDAHKTPEWIPMRFEDWVRAERRTPVRR